MTAVTPDTGGGASFVRGLLVCPLCKSALEHAPDAMRCIGCRTVFSRSRTDCYELLPRGGEGASAWRERQDAMEAWYRGMVSTEWAQSCFDRDYEPLRDLLARCRGTVLDLGGGAGITRSYLRPDVQYISVDPSLMWLAPEWTAFRSASPERPGEPVFIQGTGEALPLAARSVDTVLALWSLNHVRHPHRVCEEICRVLKPGGCLLVVPEDMEPRWTDFALRWRAGRDRRQIGRELAAKLLASLPGGRWPLQTDHVRITEQDLDRWTSARLVLRRRAWIGDYLTLEYAYREGHAA